VAKTPGNGSEARIKLRRPLAKMVLPGLSIDSGCRFEAIAAKQAAEILETWKHLGTIDGFRELVAND
jgi:hypothetical protein